MRGARALQVSSEGAQHKRRQLPWALLAMTVAWLTPQVLFWIDVSRRLADASHPVEVRMLRIFILITLTVGTALWWLPTSYFTLRTLERSGRIYEFLGVHIFRRFAADGDWINRRRRRRDAAYRVVHDRSSARHFAQNVRESERIHLVLFTICAGTMAYAVAIQSFTWAVFFCVANVVANVYPIMLQRYTRSRLDRLQLRADHSCTGTRVPTTG